MRCLLAPDLTLGSTSETALGVGGAGLAIHLPPPTIRRLHTLQGPISTFQGSASAFPLLRPVDTYLSAKAQSLGSHPCPRDSSCLFLRVCFHVTLGTDYRPQSLSVPKSVSPPPKYGCAWGEVHIGSPWSAQATQICVCGAQGCGHAMIWDWPAWDSMCLHGQVSHRCLWGSKLGVSGVWVSLGA